MKSAIFAKAIYAIKPIIAIFLVGLGIWVFTILDEPLWGIALLLITLLYATFIIKPIYSVLILIIIRPALDQYSSNLELRFIENFPIGGTILFSIISIIFTLIVLTNLIKKQKSQNLTKNKAFHALVAFVAIAVISVFYSIYRSESFFEIGRIISVFLYFVIFYLYTDSYKKFKKLAYAVYISAIIPFSLAVWQLIQGQGIVSDIGESIRVYGTFAHPNHLSIFSFLVFGLALAILLQEYSLNKKIDKVSLAIAIVSIVMILLASARSPFLALLIFLFLIGIKKYRKLLLIIIILIIVFALIYPPFYQRASKIFDMDQASSGRWRLEYWHDMYKYRITERPVFGHGIGTTVFVAESLFGPIWNIGSYEPHNDYLLMLSELGYVGLVIYTGFLITILGYLIIFYKKNKELSPLMIGIIALLIGTMFIEGFDNFFRGSALMIVFFSIMGAALRLAETKVDKTKEKQSN